MTQTTSTQEPAEAGSLQSLDFAALVEGLGSMVFVKDLQGRYTYVNQQVCALYGKDAKDIVGKDSSAFIHKDLLPPLLERERQVLEEGIVVEAEDEIILRHNDDLRYLASIKKPLRDKDGTVIGLLCSANDITYRMAAEYQLEEQRAELETILNTLDIAIYLKDEEHRYLYLNQYMADLANTTPDEAIGKTDRELYGDLAADNFAPLDTLTFTQTQPVTGEECFTSHLGIQYHFWSVKAPLPAEEGQPKKYVGMSTEMGQFEELKGRLFEEATQDHLTATYNRSYLFQLAENELQRVLRYQNDFSIMVLDLDNFEAINDQVSYHAGDVMLTEVAKVCLHQARETDHIGRTGGNEFCILLPETCAARATALAERLLPAITGIRLEGNWEGTLSITASIGITERAHPEESFGDILKRATRALRQAKDQGGSQMVTLETHDDDA